MLKNKSPSQWQIHTQLLTWRILLTPNNIPLSRASLVAVSGSGRCEGAAGRSRSSGRAAQLPHPHHSSCCYWCCCCQYHSAGCHAAAANRSTQVSIKTKPKEFARKKVLQIRRKLCSKDQIRICNIGSKIIILRKNYIPIITLQKNCFFPFHFQWWSHSLLENL